MKADRALNISRGVFGSIAAISALVTFILLGVSMDSANFPGSNLKIAEYGDGDDREGEYIQILNGYKLELDTGCSNFVEGANGLVAGRDPAGVCKASSDNNADNAVENWNSGWVVAPDCERTKELTECAPFNTNNALSIFGQMTFVVLSIQVILFAAHTCVAVVQQEKDVISKAGSTGKSTFQVMKDASSKTKATLGLTITWAIIGFALFMASYVGWTNFCDKIDTGLGRRVAGHDAADTYDNATPACATPGCTMTFGSIITTFVFAVVWYRIPNILVWFGVLEAV
jgi:hypothetical protein